jgi:hypothetical protein
MREEGGRRGNEGHMREEEGGVPVGFRQNLGEVLDGRSHVAQVDVVKDIIAVKPWALAVIDQELDIGRNPCGLDGTEVDAENRCTGVLISHFYVPRKTSSAPLLVA